MLRRIQFTLVLLTLCSLFAPKLSAQTASEKLRPRNILEALEQINPGEGFVTIIQDPDLRGVIGRIAPTLSSYITFRAPFWRLTVGNFTSQQEARSARARLMTALPAWGHESYVVREKVRILNYTAPHASEE